MTGAILVIEQCRKDLSINRPLPPQALSLIHEFNKANVTRWLGLADETRKELARESGDLP